MEISDRKNFGQKKFRTEKISDRKNFGQKFCPKFFPSEIFRSKCTLTDIGWKRS